MFVPHAQGVADEPPLLIRRGPGVVEELHHGGPQRTCALTQDRLCFFGKLRPAAATCARTNASVVIIMDVPFCIHPIHTYKNNYFFINDIYNSDYSLY